MLSRVPVKNPEENNSVVELYVQSVPDNLHTRSLLDLLEQASFLLPAAWQWQAAAADTFCPSQGVIACASLASRPAEHCPYSACVHHQQQSAACQRSSAGMREMLLGSHELLYVCCKTYATLAVDCAGHA